jgi:branched-chain amino acid transport system substrate-binding protein
MRTLLIACLATAALAADGITADAIAIGQSAPLSGPAKGLGEGMALGLKAAFTAVNAAGGVHGRRLVLTTRDDGYEPDRCVDNTAKLVEEDKVFILGGYVGTPTSKAALQVINEVRVPLIGAFTGAMLLRKPEEAQVVNLRASYDQETEALVERLTTDLKFTRIAVFHQNDAFGQAGLSGTEKALAKRGLTMAGKATFERNTVAVKTGLADMIAAKPQAVVLVGPYKPVATIAKEAKAAGFAPVFATISFVGTESLLAEGGADVDGMVVSQVVPPPADASVPVVKAYQGALAAVDPAAKPGYISLEGYITGLAIIEGLKAAGPAPERAGVLGAFAAMRSDLGGFPVAWDPALRQLSQTVWLTQIRGGAAVPVTAIAAP